MKISEADTTAGKLVDIGCPDLSTEAGQITEAQIIRNNH